MRQESIEQFLEQAIPIARELKFEDKANQAEGLLNKLKQGELMLAFVGSTSAGKSTVINNLLGGYFLPVSSIPTTGVMTLIRIDSVIKAPEYSQVMINDNKSKIINFEDFQNLSQQDSDDYYLLLDLPDNGHLPSGTILMDVPGYNSLRRRHDIILAQWLPHMDRIVWIINAKLGVHQSDKAFFKYASQIDKDLWSESLMLLVNMPAAKFENRMDEIRSRVSDITGGIIPSTSTFTAVFRGKNDRNAILDLEDFYRYLKDLFSHEQRQEYLCQRIYELSLFWLNDIRHEAKLINQQKHTDIKEMKENIESRIRYVQEQKKQAEKLLKETRQNWDNDRNTNMETLDEKIWTDVNEAIAEGSVLSAKETAEHVFLYLIPDIFTSESNSFMTHFDKETNRICDELQAILMDDFSGTWAPDMQPMDYDPCEGADNEMLSKMTEHTARKFLTGYLSKMGGRAGKSGVVGVMNLSRKGMGLVNKSAKFMGSQKNVFGREAMGKVGGLLKRFGLTTSRVIEGGAFVAIELVSFLYKEATWRYKLRSKLKKILINEKPSSKGPDCRPVYDYDQAMVMLCSEILSAFKNDVELVIDERLNFLEVQKEISLDAKVYEEWEVANQKMAELRID